MPSPTNITAAILCGGQGTRLKPVLEAKGLGHLPKCLAPVAGRPFVAYVLNHLSSQGVKVAFFCARQDIEDKLMATFNSDWKGMELGYWSNTEPQGTGGDLRSMMTVLADEAYSDPVLVVNGDTFCKFDLPYMLGHSINPFTGERKKAVLLSKNAKACGVWLISKKLIKENTQDLQTVLNGTLVGNSCCLAPARIKFLDIGTPESYAQAESFLREQGMIRD